MIICDNYLTSTLSRVSFDTPLYISSNSFISLRFSLATLYSIRELVIQNNQAKEGTIQTKYQHVLFYKNTLYKNVQDKIGQKAKNILRILP